MQQPLHTCTTKAIIADGDQMRMGPRWVTARRARLKLYDDHLQFGARTIAYGDVREAVLASFRTPLLRIPGYVLSIRTDANTFHFGLNAGSFWKGELPFPASRTTSKLRMSAFSLLVRGVLIGYIAFLVWRWFAS